ncbi:MAG: EpsG family protein [Aestuariibaculum sp.]
MCYITLIISIVYIGLRPISHYFVDMVTYAAHYNRYLEGFPVLTNRDISFHIFMKMCSYIMSTNMFFFLCVLLYIYPMYFISKRFFGQYWFYCFIMFIVSFSFWPYAVNGIRNGIATSFFLMAFAFSDKKVFMVLFMCLACLFHKTLLLPTIAYIVTLYNNNPKVYIKLWLTTIPLSLFLGGVWITLFSSLGFADDRFSYLTSELDANIKVSGFRWDFLLYSAFAVFFGWYFIFKKGFADKYYYRLYGIYLIGNSFWILVIRANFSNRFAYISWFMMGIIIIYPLLKQRFYSNQNLVIGNILLVYFSFTYFMFKIYN